MINCTCNDVFFSLQARPLLLRAVETGDFGELVDPRLERQYADTEMFRMIETAAACVRHSAPKRPRMVQVITIIDNYFVFIKTFHLPIYDYLHL